MKNYNWQKKHLHLPHSYRRTEMKWGISGDASLLDDLPYAPQITQAFSEAGLSPVFGYSIASEETIIGEMNDEWIASTIISEDGGYGLFQLTPSASGVPLPENWQDPLVNARCAVANWFTKADMGGFPFWSKSPYYFVGTTLIKCVAASWNGGRNGALAGHTKGNVDMYTTDGNYGSRVVGDYEALLNGLTPW